MKMLNRFYILTLFALLSFSILGAQTTDPDRESRILYLFEKSKEYATTKQYQKAISSCREILSLDSITQMRLSYLAESISGVRNMIHLQ